MNLVQWLPGSRTVYTKPFSTISETALVLVKNNIILFAFYLHGYFYEPSVSVCVTGTFRID